MSRVHAILPRFAGFGFLLRGAAAAALGVLAARLEGQADGALRWSFTTLSSSTAGNIVSSPAVGLDGTLYIGEEVGSSTSATPAGRVFALKPDGTQRWVFNTPDWVDSTPVVA